MSLGTAAAAVLAAVPAGSSRGRLGRREEDEAGRSASGSAVLYEYRQVFALGDDGKACNTRAVGIAESSKTDGELYVAGIFTDARIGVPILLGEMPNDTYLSANGAQPNRLISQAFLVKLTLKGSGGDLVAATKGFAWAHQSKAPTVGDPPAGNTTANGIAALRDEDGVVLVGTFDISVAWDVNSEMKNVVESPSIYVFRIDANGESQWGAQFPQILPSQGFKIVSCCSVLAEKTGEVSVVGNFAGSLAATTTNGQQIEVSSDSSSASSPFLLRLASADGSLLFLTVLRLSSSSFVSAAVASHPSCGHGALAGCAHSADGGRECFIGRRHDDDATVEVIARWAVGTELSLDVLARSVTLNVVKTVKECMYVVSGLHSNCPNNQVMAYMRAMRMNDGALLWERNISDASALTELRYPLAVSAFPSGGAYHQKVIVSGAGTALSASLGGGQSNQRRNTYEGYILVFRARDGELIFWQYLYKGQSSVRHLAGHPLALQPARGTNASVIAGSFRGPPPTFHGKAPLGGGGSGGGESFWIAVVEDTNPNLGSIAELDQTGDPRPEDSEPPSNPWSAVVTVFAVAAALLVPLFLCTRRALKPIIVSQTIALREFVSSTLPSSGAAGGAAGQSSSARAEHDGLLGGDDGSFSELDEGPSPLPGDAREEEGRRHARAATFTIDSEDET